MFKFVHHIECLVRNRDEIVAYMGRNFGMRPDKLLEHEAGRWKEAHYRVGQTLLRMREPAAGTADAQFLAKTGPGFYQVAWGVENVSEVAQQLAAKGVTLRDEQGFRPNSLGFYIAHIDPKDSPGIHFQMVQESE